MAPVTVSLTIPEADVARVKTAAESFTGLITTELFKPTAKELLAATIKTVTLQVERQQHEFTPPGIA